MVWQELRAKVSIDDVSVLVFTIGDEHGNDSPHGKRILKRVVTNLRALLGVRSNDSRDIHNLPDENTVKAITPPGKNGSTVATESPSTARILRHIRNKVEHQWKRETYYR